MMLRVMKLYADLMSKISLKTRFILVFFINCAVVLFLIGTISYVNLHKLYENIVRDNIQKSLDDTRLAIQNSYEDIQNITKQFAYKDSVINDDGIGNALKQYIDFIDNKTNYDYRQTFQFINTINKFRSSVNFITSINPDIGLSLFYGTGNNSIFFSSTNISASTLKLPKYSVVQKSDQIVLNGIHPTVGDGNYDVISVIRKIETNELDDAYVYVETSNQWFSTLLKGKRLDTNQIFLMTDDNSKVIYSNNDTKFPIGTYIKTAHAENRLISYEDYFVLSSVGDGWKVFTAIQKSEYNHEIINWVKELGFVVLICLLITMLITIFMWKSIYRPIRVFRREFKLLSINASSPQIRRTRIKEFDELLLEFYNARTSINRLLREVEQKERQQKELEIEKLRIQINPHFIYNTLNSIQWMARLNGQDDIEKMATQFARVLKYNLGKKDIVVMLHDEINAIETYLDLQKTRFNLVLETYIDIEQSLKEVRIPRFILQPIVENAIFHGINDKKKNVIKITASKHCDDFFSISVQDNGQGIDSEEVRDLLSGKQITGGKSGLGIGLKYVNSTIQFYYGEQYHLEIESRKGFGTTVSIRLPMEIQNVRWDVLPESSS